MQDRLDYFFANICQALHKLMASSGPAASNLSPSNSSPANSSRALPPPANLPRQRWQIAPDRPEIVEPLAEVLGLPVLCACVLVNRGFATPEDARFFLRPEERPLPEPVEEFPDLAGAIALLQDAIATQQPIAICGDYDADGMTSTALLLRSLRWLGGDVRYAIPSRMQEGYGINRRIVEEFHEEGVALVLTVDNGIAAYDPIARARELGLQVIVTDHHDIPPKLPPANAILNPKLIAESSPYRGIAGVGVAYILALCLARQAGRLEEFSAPLLELFTLGTIADLAPLVGVNRAWVRQGLRKLPLSQIVGVKALIQVSGVGTNAKSLKPEDIGFRLGPRINAVGRIADPQTVISLLTTDDMGEALERAMQCEDINLQRRQLCDRIEAEAIALVEASAIDLAAERVLVLVQPDWHHGVIGIVASRLVERYGAPVFIGTYEDEGRQHARGSARGIPEFDVFAALQACDAVLEKYGGHRAAGGFSLRSQHLARFRRCLQEFSRSCLDVAHLKPLVEIDAPANFTDLTFPLYRQLQQLEPCGIQNRSPVFWTANVRVLEQKVVGKGHLKLTLAQGTDRIKAIAWRWGEYCPLPDRIDVAYKLRENTWNGQTSLELELVGARSPTIFDLPFISFYYRQRQYSCGVCQNGAGSELKIRNDRGETLIVTKGQRVGRLVIPGRGDRAAENKEVNVCQPDIFHLIKAARQALGI